MTLRELQKQIKDLYTEYDRVLMNKPQSKEILFIHLVEEVGELAAQYVNQEHRKEKYSQEEVKNAIGDILIDALYLAEVLGVDSEPVIQKIIEEDRKTLQTKS